MNNYSYTEIQDMQKRAMERVREMKRNSDIVTQSVQKDLDTEHINSPIKTVSPKVTNMPPNFPQENQYPSFKTSFEEERKDNMQKKEPMEKQHQKSGENTVEALFSEPDKTMLLGLILLLKSEKADEALIMALMYIMS